MSENGLIPITLYQVLEAIGQQYQGVMVIVKLMRGMQGNNRLAR